MPTKIHVEMGEEMEMPNHNTPIEQQVQKPIGKRKKKLRKNFAQNQMDTGGFGAKVNEVAIMADDGENFETDGGVL